MSDKLSRGTETQKDQMVRSIAERIAEGALTGDPVLIRLMERVSPNLPAMGLGDVVDDYRAKRRRKMN